MMPGQFLDYVVSQPLPSEPEGRILRFQPRGSLLRKAPPPPPQVPDLGEYERAPEEPDDFRHRSYLWAGLCSGPDVPCPFDGYDR